MKALCSPEENQTDVCQREALGEVEEPKKGPGHTVPVHLLLGFAGNVSWRHSTAPHVYPAVGSLLCRFPSYAEGSLLWQPLQAEFMLQQEVMTAPQRHIPGPPSTPPTLPLPGGIPELSLYPSRLSHIPTTQGLLQREPALLFSALL